MGKINYRIIVFVFVSLLVTAYLLNIAASPAVEFNVSLTKTVGMPGDTFNITVNVTNTESSDIKDFTMLVRVPVGWNVTTQPYVTGDIENASNAEYYVVKKSTYWEHQVRIGSADGTGDFIQGSNISFHYPLRVLETETPGNYTIKVGPVYFIDETPVLVPPKTFTFKVLTCYDVNIEPSHQAKAGRGEVDYLFRITNTGFCVDSFSLTASSSRGWTVEVLNESLIPITNTGTLSSGESKNVTLRVHVPESEGCGVVDTTTLNATSVGDPTKSATATADTTVGVGGFDTGPGTYPSIFGTHYGTITPNQTVNISKLYTYPCSGTGGHSEWAAFYNSTTGKKIASGSWKGYTEGDYHYIEFEETFVLHRGIMYNYIIHTGSYPQIIHQQNHTTLDGSLITCTKFIDANGKEYNDWILAIRLE